MGNIKYYLGSRTFSNMKILRKEIEDKWNQIDVEFCKRLTDSVKRRVNIWISLEGALTNYYFLLISEIIKYLCFNYKILLTFAKKEGSNFCCC